jgi:DNA-directed RNA polymerase alpha subunit
MTGCRELADALQFTESELMGMANFGRKSLNELREALHARNMSLQTEAVMLMRSDLSERWVNITLPRHI